LATAIQTSRSADESDGVAVKRKLIEHYVKVAKKLNHDHLNLVISLQHLETKLKTLESIEST
jgi:beta-glucosidase/6-phospho-beta-glucosidase/beta-galactosidase